MVMKRINLMKKMHRKTLFSIYLSVHRISIKNGAFYIIKIDGERIFVLFIIKNMSFIVEKRRKRAISTAIDEELMYDIIYLKIDRELFFDVFLTLYTNRQLQWRTKRFAKNCT